MSTAAPTPARPSPCPCSGHEDGAEDSTCARIGDDEDAEDEVLSGLEAVDANPSIRMQFARSEEETAQLEIDESVDLDVAVA